MSLSYCNVDRRSLHRQPLPSAVCELFALSLCTFDFSLSYKLPSIESDHWSTCRVTSPLQGLVRLQPFMLVSTRELLSGGALVLNMGPCAHVKSCPLPLTHSPSTLKQLVSVRNLWAHFICATPASYLRGLSLNMSMSASTILGNLQSYQSWPSLCTCSQ